MSEGSAVRGNGKNWEAIYGFLFFRDTKNSFLGTLRCLDNKKNDRAHSLWPTYRGHRVFRPHRGFFSKLNLSILCLATELLINPIGHEIWETSLHYIRTLRGFAQYRYVLAHTVCTHMQRWESYFQKVTSIDLVRWMGRTKRWKLSVAQRLGV